MDLCKKRIFFALFQKKTALDNSFSKNKKNKFEFLIKTGKNCILNL